jgi:DNA-binding CsgD family transcriptional regulator
MDEGKLVMLTNTDLKSILRFQQELYISCNIEVFSKKVISTLPKVISSELTVWSTISFQERRVSFVTTPITVNDDELAKIASLYFYEHPTVQYYSQTGDSTAHKISDFLSESQLYRLEGLYQKLLRPLCMEDQMVLVVQNSLKTTAKSGVSKNQDREEIIVALHRPKRDFCERDRLILNLLRPHLLVAYQNAQAVTQMQQQLAQLNQTLEQWGTVILTSDLQVKVMTKIASELITYYFQTSSSTQTHLPDNLLRWVKHNIFQLNQSNELYQPCLPLQLEQEGKRLIVRLIAQAGEEYILLLEEQKLQSLSSELIESLGLTKREAEVLFWVIQDKSDNQIALMLNLSIGTVKKHLEHIYQKLGVSSRIAAMMYALKSLGMLKC